MRLALAISSLLILIVHGSVFFQQFFHRWERHQTAYFDQAKALSKNDLERAALNERSPRIEQTIVTNFGEQRVDRCVTCHVASDDPRFAGHAQPLRSHPYSASLGDRKKDDGSWERRHKFADFGCTVCHEGQGRGLQTHYAHGEDHYWPDPLLGYVSQETWKKEYLPHLKGKEFLEVGCAQCHTEENFAGTPTIARGRQLFFSSNCYGCHKVEGIADGTLGPDLSEAGKKFKIDYLWESIVHPRANSATSYMPKFNLKPDEVKAIVVFLKSRKGINFAETGLERYRTRLADAARAEGGPAQAAKAVAGGAELIDRFACLACHKMDGKDGGIAPDITFAGLMRDEKWIYDHFKDPRALMSDSIMPSFKFTEAQFQTMSTYLAGRKTPAPAAWNGAELYKEVCARCHGEKGDGLGPIAIYIDPAPRDLTKTAFMNSKPRDRFKKAIQEGVAGTSMPPWAKVLTDAQIDSLLDHLETAFVKTKRGPARDRKLPETNPVAMSKDSMARGEAIFVQRCGGCHGKKGDGKGPNSLDIVPRPRNLRNAHFVESVSDKRMFESILYGVQGTAMPPWIDYGMSQKDVGDLVNFIRGMNAKPAQRAAVR
jgi:sulfur oxidation c-type cytochrome SoxX